MFPCAFESGVFMDRLSAETRILVAARTLFFEHGFAKVSTDMLAREASVSKATIYRHFENMTEILRRLIEIEISKISGARMPTIETRADLEQALTEFGIRLLTFLNQSDTVEFGRVIHEEARQNVDMGQAFFSVAFDNTHRTVAKMFAHAGEHQIITLSATPDDIAEDLIALFKGSGMTAAMLGVLDVPYGDIEGKVQRAVQTILKVYG